MKKCNEKIQKLWKMKMKIIKIMKNDKLKMKMKIIKIMKNEIMKNEKCNEKLWK